MLPALAQAHPVESRPGSEPQPHLWLALHFHDLPLHGTLHGRSAEVTPRSRAIAVFGTAGRTQHVVGMNAQAARQGICMMMTPGEARAACASVLLRPRDPAREGMLLERLADVLGEFSAEVSICDDLTLVMEAGRSLRLFGGAEALLHRLGERLQGAPAYCHAAAPTPLAAALCARNGLAVIVTDPNRLRSMLSTIPARCLAPDEKMLRMLSAMGIDTLRDLFRLPRQGLARRFGSSFTRLLERLLGQCPDIPLPHRFRQRFRDAVDLDTESTDLNVVIGAARRLLEILEHQLVQCDSAVTRVSWILDGGPGNPRITFVTQPRAPTWRADVLEELLRLRLESETLASPVRALSLESGFFAPRSSCLQGHIPGFVPAAGADHEFIDRLRARLGQDAVRGVRLLPDYRPEHAWSTCEPGQISPPPPPAAVRPLWLLPEPCLLTGSDHPHLDGPLRLFGSAERIRCGWWDNHRVFRDYRQAVARSGQRLWIFRSPSTRQWYLHGLY